MAAFNSGSRSASFDKVGKLMVNLGNLGTPESRGRRSDNSVHGYARWARLEEKSRSRGWGVKRGSRSGRGALVATSCKQWRQVDERSRSKFLRVGEPSNDALGVNWVAGSMDALIELYFGAACGIPGVLGELSWAKGCSYEP